MSDIFAFNLNHLRYFYEVARAGNMRRAALRLGISQPALSKQIQALEEAVALQLFYRSSQGLKPTPDGEAVFTHCQRVFGHLRDLEDTLESRRTGSSGRLSVGAVVSIGTYLLPSYLGAFRQAHPRVKLRVMTSRSAQVLQALREHRIDVGYVAGLPADDDIQGRLVMTERLIPIVAADHALSAGSSINPEALDGLDMVAFDPDAPTRMMTESYLGGLGVAPRVAAECANLEAIKRLVREGLGFAVVPCHSAEEDMGAGRLRELTIKGWDLSRELYVVHLKHQPLSPAVRQFVASASELVC